MSWPGLIPFSTPIEDELGAHVARGLTLELADFLRACGADPLVLTSAQTEEDGAWRKLVSFREELSGDTVSELVRGIHVDGEPELNAVISGLITPVGEDFRDGLNVAVTITNTSANFPRGRCEADLTPARFRENVIELFRDVAECCELEVEAEYDPLTDNFHAWLNLLITRALTLAAEIGAVSRDATGLFEPALEALRLDPKLTAARDKLGELAQVLVLERGHEPETAVAALDTAETRAGRDWRSVRARGQLLLATDQFGPAAKAFCQVLSGRHEAPDVHERMTAALLAGRAFNLAARHVEAQRVLSVAMQDEALKVEAIVESGVSSAAMGEGVVAERLWRRAIELEPNSVPALLHLARHFRNRGEIEKSAAQYARLVKIKGLPREVFADATEFFVVNQLHHKARRAAERFIEEYPGDALGHVLLAGALNALGRHGKALKALDKAEVCTGVDEYAGLVTRQRRYAEHPDSEEAFRRLADEAMTGDAAEAETGLRELTGRFGDFWEAWLFLGISLRRQEQWEQAREVLEDLRGRHELPGIDKELTGIYSRLNQPEAALECAKRAMDAAPEDPTLITNYAAALLENDRVDDALKYARRAEMLMPEDESNRKLMQLIEMRLSKRGLIRNVGAVFKEAIGEATKVLRRKKGD